MRYAVERHDQDDGSIHYEIWDTKEHRRLFTVLEDPVDDDEECRERGQALKDANLIVRALNYLAMPRG